MKYISKIVQGSQELYLKDAEARASIAALESYTDYLGVTSTELTDGATTNPIVINEENVTAVKGNIVNYNSKEFIFNGTAWQEFGDLSGLGSLAYKSSAEASYKPAGTNSASAVSFSGTETSDFVTGVNAEAVAPSFTEGTFSAGTLPSFAEGAFSAGTLPSKEADTFAAGSLPSLGEATKANFASEGVVASYAEETETLTFSAASTAEAVTAQGTFSAGTLPSYTEGTFSAGTLPSKEADTFSAGTLPSKDADMFSAGSAATFNTAKAVTSLGTATAAAQVFDGTTTTITVA